MIKTLKAYAGDIIIGSLILCFLSIKWFLLFLFIELILLIDNIRKLVRFYQLYNEIKIIAIIRKLKITDDEISIVMDGEKRNIGEEKWKEIENDLKELIR